MDCATDHLVKDRSSGPAPGRTDPPLGDDVGPAKRQLIDAARAFDPLAPLRRHPWTTVAAAAAIGVVAASPAAGRAVSGMLPSGWTARLARIAFARLAAPRPSTVAPVQTELPADSAASARANAT